jgi:DNA-binding response OmpR family regulator
MAQKEIHCNNLEIWPKRTGLIEIQVTSGSRSRYNRVCLELGGCTMTDRPLILMVDSNRTNLDLLSHQLNREGFETVRSPSLDDLSDVLKNRANISLALVDISGFDQSIWPYCERLHLYRIPFIVISPQRSHLTQRESTKYGASAVLVKPLGVREMMEAIHTLLGD